MKMSESFAIQHNSPRFVLVEIAAGYALTLGVAGLLFGLATGIGVQVPWEVFISISVLAAGLCLTALRKRGVGQI